MVKELIALIFFTALRLFAPETTGIMATLNFGPPLGGPFLSSLMVVPRKDLRDNHHCGNRTSRESPQIK
jgi:hypothetical protein